MGRSPAADPPPRFRDPRPWPRAPPSRRPAPPAPPGSAPGSPAARGSRHAPSGTRPPRGRPPPAPPRTRSPPRRRAGGGAAPRRKGSEASPRGGPWSSSRGLLARRRERDELGPDPEPLEIVGLPGGRGGEGHPAELPVPCKEREDLVRRGGEAVHLDFPVLHAQAREPCFFRQPVGQFLQDEERLPAPGRRLAKQGDLRPDGDEIPDRHLHLIHVGPQGGDLRVEAGEVRLRIPVEARGPGQGGKDRGEGENPRGKARHAGPPFLLPPPPPLHRP